MSTATDLVIRDEPRASVSLSNDQLQYISRTEFVPPGLRGNLPAILACVATGRALGIADMTALRSIHVIDGKATFSAELMVQLVRRAGHSITGDVTGEAATVTGTRADNGDTMTMTWTLAMAERAGLLSKANWKRYPESMLWARAVSQLSRMLFADCFAGTTYTAEELDDSEVSELGGEAEPVLAATAQPRDSRGGELPEASDTSASSLTPDDDGLFPPPGVPEGLTEAQARKLNVLVGQLRAAGHVTTEHLWRGCGYDPEPSEDGELHWSPLRDRLTKVEATALIDRLAKLEEAVTKKPFDVPKDVREALEATQ